TEDGPRRPSEAYRPSASGPFVAVYLRGAAQITFPDLKLEKEITMAVAPQIPEHMDVVSSDGQQGNHVDRVEGGRIKLAKRLPVLAMSVALSALCCVPPVFAQGPRQDQAPRS